MKVHTAQNVLLEFPVGNVGQRILAAFLDLVVCGLYVFIARWIFLGLAGIELFNDNPTLLFYAVIVLPVLLYLPFIEYLWNGKTIGKAALKLQVIRADGSAPSLGDIILRWLVRTVDVKLGFLLIFFVPRVPSSESESMFMAWAAILTILPLPIVGIISMATSPIGQRLGDRLANTVVIQSKRIFSLDDTILKATEETYIPTYSNVLNLRDKDIYIIKNTIEQAENSHQYANVKKLADKAREVLNITDDTRPLILLKTLVKDYNHLARERDLNA
ncbi:MAG: RDD family protein [Cyclobacteriaceae bacterium]